MAYSRADNNQPTKNGQRKYYLSRIDLKKYNVIIDGRNFYDNPIESDIEKYRELKKLMIGKGEDYTIGFFVKMQIAEAKTNIFLILHFFIISGNIY